MTRAIICGGRYYGRIPIHVPPGAREAIERAAKERFVLTEALDHLRAERKISFVITGGAPGADTLAHQWALSRCLQTKIFRAEWKRFGNSAGPIRNARMLEEGQPDFVIAFEGGNGTRDMIKQARTAGVEIIDRGGA